MTTKIRSFLTACTFAVVAAIAAPASASCYACYDGPSYGGGTTTRTAGMSAVAEFTREGSNFTGALGDRAGANARQHGTTSSFTTGLIGGATDGCPGGCGTTRAAMAAGGAAHMSEVGNAWAHSAGHGARTAETVSDGRSRTTGGVAMTIQTPGGRTRH